MAEKLTFASKAEARKLQDHLEAEGAPPSGWGWNPHAVKIEERWVKLGKRDPEEVDALNNPTAPPLTADVGPGATGGTTNTNG